MLFRRGPVDGLLTLVNRQPPDTSHPPERIGVVEHELDDMGNELSQKGAAIPVLLNTRLLYFSLRYGDTSN